MAVLALSSAGLSQAPPAEDGFVARVEIGLRYRIAPGEYRWLEELVPKDIDAPEEVKVRVAALERDMRLAYERRMEPLLKRSADCAVGRGPHESPESAREFKSLVDDRNRATAAFDSTERDAIVLLCDALKLDELTRAEIDRVRLVRLRQHLGVLGCDLPPAEVDLEPLLRPALADPRAPADPCLRDALRGYADEIYIIRAQHARMRLREESQDALDFTVGGARGETLIEHRRQRNAQRLRTERLLMESTREWAYRIAECLPPGAQAAFLDRWRSRGFPLVYPTPYDLRDLVTEIGRADGIATKSKEQLLPALDGLRSQVDAVSSRMEVSCLDSWSKWALSHAGEPSRDSEKLAEKLHSLDRQRQELALQAVALLGADESVRSLSAFERFRERVSAGDSIPSP